MGTPVAAASRGACGLSSTVHGNNIAVDHQRRQLAPVVETAAEVWG
ncbi:MAG TPA: hypothetical protein PKB14_09475 [Rubrivivax sp.]|nr:hypothetical protein [Rubrivivax sp.]